MGKNLYKVVFAEDEVPLRKAICQIMDWESMGYELVCEAENGQEALEFIETNKADVLLTDICMPLMDGLELTRRVREKMHGMKIVILTGYDEFAYAQEAVNLNVAKYILKPTTPTEFREVMVGLKEELDAELSQQRSVLRYRQQYEESQKIIREKTLMSLVSHGGQNLVYTKENCRRLEIDLEAKRFIAAVCHIDNKEKVAKEFWDGDYQLIDFAIVNVCREVLGAHNQDLVFLGQGQDVVAILKEKSDDHRRFSDYAVDVMTELKYNINRVFSLDMTVGIGDAYGQFEEIPYSYRDAVTALEYLPLMGKQKIIVRSDIERKASYEHQKLDEMLDVLEHIIKAGEADRVKPQIEHIFHMIKMEHMSISEFKTLLLKLTVNLLNVFNDVIQMNDRDEYIPFEVFNQVYKMKNLDQIKDYYIGLSHDLIQRIKRARIEDQSGIVDRAIGYINQNFGDKNLDVQSVCEYLHVSTSYFSRLFKTETDETFVEHVTRKRMEKAKEFLKTTNMKVAEISMAVGYEDPHYFSYNFRKQMGLTPTEYRNHEGNQG